MTQQKIHIPLWQRLIGIVGPVLVTIGVFAYLDGGAPMHPALGDPVVKFGVLVLGGGLMVTDMLLRVRLLQARRERDKKR